MKKIDLFEHPELIPEPVQSILKKYEDEYLNGATYELNERLLNELKPVGYSFEYYLDAEPYNLHKTNQK